MSDPNSNPVQRYSTKALLDFTDSKAKVFCEKCNIVFLADEKVCPKCKGQGVPFVDNRFL